MAGQYVRGKYQATGSGLKPAFVWVPVIPVITQVALQVALELCLWCRRGDQHGRWSVGEAAKCLLLPPITSVRGPQR